MIRLALPADLAELREIERAAGELFRGLGMAAIADDEPASVAELAGYQQDSRAWVATGAEERPVAYLLAEVVDGHGHLEQVSVHPSHARQGLGRLLIEAADAWAASLSLAGLTLTTYAEVPWNAPYYARLGFRIIPEPELTEGLRTIREHEKARGLDAWPRVGMRRPGLG
ncbi:GNAT family N-acetyltransferase [Amycolatopsis sp. H20-H5]|uniref:GNAT family N-acetyltransferase n=1 Tax=Amycolatopsis sp. H20-H5 TaxID=3046309 RepID=UPI002DBE3ABA|nr:GNAT family N-acetyltransferase [Amycolatopsis sp. H20-H5]MEC3978605.1 GNAT family N-acetyltransferase [Amycolatopsis sp. H20-H5]